MKLISREREWTSNDFFKGKAHMLGTWLAGVMVTQGVTPLARRSGSGEVEAVLRVVLSVLFLT